MIETIEEFSEEDAGELEDLFEKVWSISYDYPPEWRKRRQLKKEEIRKEIRAGYHFFGARNEDGRIVGVYKLLITEEGCFGEQQSILPEYLGKGIASAMYEQFIAFARAHHCQKNYVNILENQEVSIHLVEKYGFSKKKRFEQAEGMNVFRYERYVNEEI